MRFIQFQYEGQSRFGVELAENSDGVLDLSDQLGGVTSTMQFLDLGEAGMNMVNALDLKSQPLIPRSRIRLLAPVTQPDKVICIGMNYKDHCEEQNKPVPKEPVVFNKFPSCIVADGDPIPMPTCTTVRSNYLKNKFKNTLSLRVGPI